MKKKAIAFTLALSMLGLSACGGKPADYPIFELRPNEVLADLPNESPTHDGEIHQRTEAEIQEMNGGNATFVYGNNGKLSFLNGRFSDLKIENFEDAVLAINEVTGLMGLNKGSDLFCVAGARDDEGNTYYTFQQKYGDLTVLFSTLKVVVGPDGYTRGLSCSFDQSLGFAEETEDIGPEAALEVAKQCVAEMYPDYELNFYPEQTYKAALPVPNGMVLTAYVIYCDNPLFSALEFDMPYLELYVTLDGSFFPSLVNPTASFGSDNLSTVNTDDFFRNMVVEDHTFDVELVSGEKTTITVPVSYNKDSGWYYLADPVRKIAVADWGNSMTGQQTPYLKESVNGMDWNRFDLLAYHRTIGVYDYYASMGLDSVDGCGTPILVQTNMLDDYGQPFDNACYCGIINGWARFGYSYVNYFTDSFDTVGHEYTHGITKSSMLGTLYQNETGAINESFSDIMGNIIEMTYNATYDDTWLVGEMANAAMRSMSDPNRFGQPVSVDDFFYIPPTDQPDSYENDNGGVHQNSSLLSLVCVALYDAGMPLNELSELWVTTAQLMTPRSGYEEVHAALLMSLETNELDTAYAEVITETMEATGVLG